MTNRLELNWKLDGFVDEQRYYCSETPIDTNNLPTPKMIFAGDVRAYTDTAIEVGKTYYVRVGSIKNESEKFSQEITVSTLVNDPYFSLVDSLIFADASSFPSTAIVDSSANARSITVEGDAKIVSPSLATPKFSDGTIAFSGNGRLSLPCTALGTSDFTAEMWLKSINGGVDNGRLFAIGSQDTQGGLLFCKFPKSAVSGFNLILRDNGSFPAPIQTDRTVITGEMQYGCLMRKDGVFYVFADGRLVGYTSDYTTFSLTGTRIYLGSGSNLGDGTAAYWDSWRLTRMARYDIAGFTPPTRKFIAA
ncbi:LamG-like jellyroll fold domain-containing protein [Acinetobacter sp. ANC 3791]|uniref:LamG-like jellyroll fold domain-containing protein n=1 Tax=Acinetobacter sp. ANC 3791 TaxID=2529836 RepID=UPI00103FBEE2|nr:LamG-like jellyroll fold domain-containing protein [Acinetobacter sp. ANC 3791]TCB83205.1 hypothetical protein E0H90_12945 [Acinetobacter sp. ANC 3791]